MNIIQMGALPLHKQKDYQMHDQFIQTLQIQQMDDFTGHFLLKQSMSALLRFKQAISTDQEGQGDHHGKE